jgi:hypothetical protein
MPPASMTARRSSCWRMRPRPAPPATSRSRAWCPMRWPACRTRSWAKARSRPPSSR